MAKMWINQSGTAVPLGFKAVRVAGTAVGLDKDRLYMASGPAVSAPTSRSYLNGAQGTYWPSLTANNVGIPAGTTLTTGPTGDVIITSGGTYENLDIAGFMLIRTSQPVIIRNCRIRGWNKSFPNGGGDTGLVNCDHGNTNNSNVLVEDCDLIPDYPSPWVNGILGHDFTARRNRIRNCVDSFACRNATNPSGPVRANLWANYAYDYAYFTPDYANSNQRPNTHNDAVQVNYGSNVDITGNVFIGNGSPDAGTPPYGIGTGSGANTADGPDSVGRGVNITGGSSGSTASNISIHKNRFDNFQVCVSIPGVNPSIASGVTVENNEFGPNIPTLNTSSSRNPQHYHIQVGVGVNIEGFPAGADNTNTPDTNNGNVYQVGGAPAIIRRGSF